MTGLHVGHKQVEYVTINRTHKAQRMSTYSDP